MTLLFSSFLWLLIPLMVLFVTAFKGFTSRIHLIVLILLVLALSRPVIEQTPQEHPLQAHDIIIALDVSYSMRAEDIAPNRYTFAKETIHAFLKQNHTDNIMLIAFTSNPLLLSPPTTDHALITMALESLNTEHILTHGTSLEKLFSKVADFTKIQKNLLLITDGGEEENLEKLSMLANRTDISLHILALGSTQGVSIKKRDGTLLKDNEGHLVISRINPLLKQLASQTGGNYLQASSTPESTAMILQKSLNSQEQTSQMITKMQHSYQELYQIPLILATLLFLMLHTRAVKYLIVVFGFLGTDAYASIFDSYHLHQAYHHYENKAFTSTQVSLEKVDSPSLQSQFVLASTYYKLQQYKKALQTYKSIKSTSAKTKQSLYYNIGNCYAKLNAFAKAKTYYTKALQLGEDEDSSANLQLIVLLQEKKKARLGITHPKSQSDASSKSESQEESKESRGEDQPSSGSGGSGENTAKNKEKNKLLLSSTPQKQPLSSKVYELINKGYIHEKQPW